MILGLHDGATVAALATFVGHAMKRFSRTVPGAVTGVFGNLWADVFGTGSNSGCRLTTRWAAVLSWGSIGSSGSTIVGRVVVVVVVGSRHG